MKSYHNEITNADHDSPDAYTWTDDLFRTLRESAGDTPPYQIAKLSDIDSRDAKNILHGTSFHQKITQIMKVAYTLGYKIKLEKID